MCKLLKETRVALGSAILSFSFLASSAYALPVLQLTIGGGTYNNSTETTLAAGNVFTLDALYSGTKASIGDTFYISAALERGPGDGSVNDLGPVSNSPISGGSFVFAGNTVNVSSGMTYGSPLGMPPHGEFDTFFKEFSFQFDASQKTAAFDTSTSTPAGALASGCVSNCLYFVPFVIDTTGLDSAYSIHFDLYLKTDGSVDKDIKAPFSHDAQSGVGGGGGGGGSGEPVPEPASLALFGLGLLGLAVTYRRRS